MNSDNWLRRCLEKLAAKLAIFFGEENFFSEIDNSNSEFFDGSRELARGMISRFDDLGRAAKQIFNTTSAEVVFKNALRIVQIADSQIKARKIIFQFWR